MSEFWSAKSEIEHKANELIASYHPEIATAKISYLFKDIASPSEIESGQVCIAKKVTGMYRTLTDDTDFVIIIASDLYTELSPTQQTAMLDSALTCCSVRLDENGEEKLDKAGNPSWVIRPHGIVAHASIIQRYGLDILKDAGDFVRSSLPEASPIDEIEEELVDVGTKKARRSKAVS